MTPFRNDLAPKLEGLSEKIATKVRDFSLKKVDRKELERRGGKGSRRAQTRKNR